MGHHCCVPHCGSNSRSSGNGAVTFHTFPIDPKERKLWILSVRRADYKKLTVNKHTKICSKHFRDEDFVQSQYSKRRMLKKGIVPSVFALTKGNQEAPQCEKKTEHSSRDSGDKTSKEEARSQASRENSSNASQTVPPEIKEADRDLSGKTKVGSSTSKHSVVTVERKVKDKIAKKEMNISSDNAAHLLSSNSTCESPTKSDDSEQGSVSDMTPTNGSSPANSSNGTPSRRQSSALNFQIGNRLEAKDLGSEIWYPVKIVEVDWDDEEILIHFEKWSQRYDEWIPMDSSRLRPIENPTPQNDGKNVSKVFNIGDRVMAKWNDSRRYPAKVKAVLGNDMYEVLFFDGFTKNIKGIRMSKLESDADNMAEIGPGLSEKLLSSTIITPIVRNEVISEAIGTKQERRERKRKINVVELFHPKKRQKLDPDASSSKSSSEVERRKKAEKGKRCKESDSAVSDGHGNEGEKKYINVDTNGTVHEAIEGSKIDETVEGRQVDEDSLARPKKKIVRRSGGGADENADKPRRGLQQGEPQGKAKSLEVKSYTRKIPGKIPLGGQEYPSTPSKSRQDSSKGNAEDEEAPRRRRKDFSNNSSKSANRSNRKESDREETVKWESDGQAGFIVESPDGPRKTTVVPDKNLPRGWSKHTIQRKHGNSAGKWDVILVNPQGRRFRSRNELRLFFEENGESFKADMFDFCLSGKRRMSRTPDDSIPSGRKMSRGPGGKAKGIIGPGDGDMGEHQSVPQQQKQQLQPQRRVKTLLPKIRRTSASQCEDVDREKNVDPTPPPPPYTAAVMSVPAIRMETEMLEGEVLVGGLKIQMENNTFKCPKDGCGKNFRKENLLQMHLKHYHPEYNKFMGSTPNVADLAYARTVGESIDDLIPKSRYSGVGAFAMGSTSYSEKTNRFEPSRKSKTGPSFGVGSGKSGGVGGNGGGGDCSTALEKKKGTSKEKQSSVATKKPGKGMIGDGDGRASADDVSGESKVPSEEKLTVVENTSAPVTDIAAITTHKEEKKEPQTTIKTLMPVIRSPSHAQEISATERLKSKFPAVEEGEEYIEVIDVGPQQIPPTHTTSLQFMPQSSVSNTQSTTSSTKSLRTIRRRRLSDFHFEPLHKRRKIASTSKLDMSEDAADVVDDSGGSPVDVKTPTTGTVGSGRSTTTTYRYSKKKTPIVHLEKLNVVTDSNAAEQPAVDHLRKEELINCTCGFMEEDGLMIQCDLCLCWQHGICNNIEKETEVPEKYVCPICLNPYRQRKSKKYLHDQDWLKEGKLPSLSFRSKNESNILEREAILKRSHDLTGSLLQIQQVLHSLRVKVNIAGKSDHPKLYLWAKSWEKEGESSSAQLTSVSQQHVAAEDEFKPQLENNASCSHNEEKAASDTSTVVPPKMTDQKDAVPIPVPSELGRVEHPDGSKQDTKTGDREVNLEQQVQKETVVAERETSEVHSLSDKIKDENRLDRRTSEKKHETEIEAVTTENVDGVESSLSNEQHPSSTNDQNNSDSNAPPSNEDQGTKIDQLQLQFEGTADKPVSPRALGNVHRHDCEAYPAAEKVQAKEEISDAGSENQVVQSEKKEGCISEVCSEEKLEVTDMCSSSEDVPKQLDPGPTEETVKSNSEKKPDETMSRLESPGLLHQTITNANPLNNGGIGGQLDTSGHPMLQLPICQSELMQFASTIADNLSATEPGRPAASGPVPVAEPPRAPQPEAPIDPVECRSCLLDHIDHFQTQIDTRLTMLEEQVAALESQDPDAAKDEGPDFYPQTKQTIQMLLRDLQTMRKIAALN
ncbi:uncharacterized protein LOC111864808 isoform X3 [Cryptotermes secundus]|uniref:uncharacterized protein LOC111864808 isoform X3 n=1 Tax=Cryptotermes secundus TaxID=105785 RepID=UPI000CD7CDF2|nr:uncharacterized protein LOC111864808 isoform X3 [Cryptotermes secundus]